MPYKNLKNHFYRGRYWIGYSWTEKKIVGSTEINSKKEANSSVSIRLHYWRLSAPTFFCLKCCTKIKCNVSAFDFNLILLYSVFWSNLPLLHDQPRINKSPLFSHALLVNHSPLDSPHLQPVLNALWDTPPNSSQNFHIQSTTVNSPSQNTDGTYEHRTWMECAEFVRGHLSELTGVLH